MLPQDEDFLDDVTVECNTGRQLVLRNQEITYDDLVSRGHDETISKLDVLHSRQINRIMYINYTTWGLCLFYLCTIAVMYNLIFVGKRTVTTREGREVTVRVLLLHKGLITMEFALAMVCSLGVIFLTAVYMNRILRYRKSSKVTHTQVWVCILLVTTACHMNPIYRKYIWAIHDIVYQGLDLLHLPPDAKNRFWFLDKRGRMLLIIGWTLKMLFSSVANILYLWGTAHSYGILDGLKTRREFASFYIPKLVPIVLYAILRILARFPFKVMPSQLPFTNFFAMITHSVLLKKWYIDVTIVISLMTVFEIYFLVCILLQVRKTMETLRHCDYWKYRAKQIGIRFFLFHNMTYYSAMIFVDIVLRPIVPRYTLLTFWLFPRVGVHVYSHSTGGVLLDIMTFINLVITAFINLPAESNGIRGWFMPTPRDDGFNNDEPLSLTTSEFSDLNQEAEEVPVRMRVPTIEHAQKLVLPAQISMLNFTFLVYDWNAKGHEKVQKLPETYKFEVFKHITDASTDTHLIVIDAADRIILAFRGTTSKMNMKTDINVTTTSLLDHVPSSNANSRVVLGKQSDWCRARIHKGFALAYSSVSESVVSVVKSLYSTNPRPIFLTGHSLGGALATICSLDLRMSLNIPSTDICVTTFGSPRCGNRQFQKTYDSFIRVHWRFAHQTDVVTMMPKMNGYTHVGKQVMLTSNGNLFLDPSGLESKVWGSAEMVGIDNHMKAAYFFALKAFCTRHLEYEAELWDFPIGKRQVIRWETLCSMTFEKKNGFAEENNKNNEEKSESCIVLVT